MNTTNERDEILGAFSVEPVHDLATLKSYLKRYPQFAEDLVELSFLISDLTEDDVPLSEHDQNRVESACSRIQRPSSSPTITVLARLKERSVEVASTLGVPRQVVTALRECVVDVSTLTQRVASSVARQLEVSVDEFRIALAGPEQSAPRLYRSDHPPRSSGKVSFEQVLREANVPEQKIVELLQDDP